MPLPCQAASRLFLLLKSQDNLPNLLYSPAAECPLLLLKTSQDSLVNNLPKFLNSHLLNQAAAKQAEVSLRIGEIPSGAIEVARAEAGKTTAGRIAHNHQKEAGAMEDEVGVDGEKVGVEDVDAAGVDVEDGAAEEEGVAMEEDRAGDKLVAVLQVAIPTPAEVVTGAR